MANRELHVTLSDGQQQAFALDEPRQNVLAVGRSEDSGVHLDDLSVSRRHARIVVEEDHVYVEDLGSSGGTYIGERRLTPHSRYVLREDDQLRFGEVRAHVEASPVEAASAPEGANAAAGFSVAAAAAASPDLPLPSPPDPLPVVSSGSSGLAADLPLPVEPADIPYQPPVAPPPPAPSSAIRVAVNLSGEAVEAGRTGAGNVTITNRGQIVEEVLLSAAGPAAAWVTFASESVTLMPGAHRDVAIQIRPPRDSSALAGPHAFEIVARSASSGAEQLAAASFVIPKFGGLVASMTPVRSAAAFDLILRNDGNAPATAALTATDPEAANRYEFNPQRAIVPAGAEVRVQLRAKPGSRPLSGQQELRPFTILVEPEGGVSLAPLNGQLSVMPRFGSLRRLGVIAALLLLGILAALAFLLWPSHKDGALVKADLTSTPTPLPPDLAEAPYAGIHLCSPTDPGPPPAPIAGTVRAVAAILTSFRNQDGADQTAPLFAQNDSRWAQHEYAKASDGEFRSQNQCGSTIAQCGCAMTSVATVMALFGLVAMSDGQPLTPDQLNSWLEDGAAKTPRGWVSRGYIYGDVVWSAVNQLSAEMQKAKPGTPRVRFVTTGAGRDEQVRSELAAGRPIILEVPGHWIAAIGVDPATNKILINDPYYADRTTLDAYAGKIRSSVLFEKSDDLSAVVITVPSDLRVKVTDSQGHVVGTFDKGTPQEAKAAAQLNIPGASYNYRESWRDPNCIEKAPPRGAGTNQIILARPQNGRYTIEVLNPHGGNTSVNVQIYDKDGNLTMTTSDKGKFDINISDASPSPSPSPSASASPTGTPTPPAKSTSTSTSTPTATATATATGTVPLLPSPTNSPTSTPTPTRTPTVTPTPTPTQVPLRASILCSAAESDHDGPQIYIRVICHGAVQGAYDHTEFRQNDVLASEFTDMLDFNRLGTFVTPPPPVVIKMEFRACKGAVCNSDIATLTVGPPDVQIQCAAVRSPVTPGPATVSNNGTILVSVTCTATITGTSDSSQWFEYNQPNSDYKNTTSYSSANSHPTPPPTFAIPIDFRACNVSLCTTRSAVITVSSGSITVTYP